MNTTKNWADCTNILCIRLDNMGDVLMTSPAFKALKKQNPKRKITLLTSSAGAKIARFIPEVDNIITFDAPWVKNENIHTPLSIFNLVKKLRKFKFDASIIFTNFSQTALPAAQICYLSGIPRRLGYSRENPYQLLTDWALDKEPLTFVRHGVLRQLDLVKLTGADTQDKSLSLKIPRISYQKLFKKLEKEKIDLNKPSVIMHPGVSEKKRQYPVNLFALAAEKIAKSGFQVILTGLESEGKEADIILRSSKGTFSLAGKLEIDELAALIEKAKLLIANNTGPVHIASAVNTPVVVLYAKTNPEHTPWKVKHKVLYFDVPKHLRSKNQILRSLNYSDNPMPTADHIFEAFKILLKPA